IEGSSHATRWTLPRLGRRFEMSSYESAKPALLGAAASAFGRVFSWAGCKACAFERFFKIERFPWVDG
ncbi:MAG TPA: hypothetical protein VJO34_16585, partial [Methylomirabilota bacterium]|nr:hypothetical protein [Methylomirabilota bacterium]